VEDAALRSAAVIDAIQRPQTADSIISLLPLLPRCGDASALTMLKAAQSIVTPACAMRRFAPWQTGPMHQLGMPWSAFYRQGSTEALRGLALRGLVRLAGEENAHPDSKLNGPLSSIADRRARGSRLRLILARSAPPLIPTHCSSPCPCSPMPASALKRKSRVKKIAESIKAEHPQAEQEALQKIQAKP